MSSSTDNRTPSSPSLLTPDELGRMLLDDPTVLRFTTTFDDEPLTMMTLRHFHFITDMIERLEHVIRQHRQEQDSIFDYLLQTPTFQDLVPPIVLEYRQNHPPPRTDPVTISPTNSDDSSPLAATTRNATPYHTPPSGSPTNPIEVYDDNDEPNVNLTIQCRKCTRTGHNVEICLFSGPPLCSRCWKYGHYQPVCNEVPVCPWCKQPGHQSPAKCAVPPLFDNTPARNAREYYEAIGVPYSGWFIWDFKR